MPQVPSTDTRQKAPQIDDAEHQHLAVIEHFQTRASPSPLVMEEAKKDNPPCEYPQRLQVGLKGQLYSKMRV